MSEEVHQLLQELPEQWANTKKLAVTVKQTVAPLQVSVRRFFKNVVFIWIRAISSSTCARFVIF